LTGEEPALVVTHRCKPIPGPEAEAILDALGEGLFSVDGDWRITRFNKAAERITGFSAEEAVGEHCWNIFRTDVCESGCVLREVLSGGGRSRSRREVTILDSENREVPVEVSAATWLDDEGRMIGGVETFRDLSEVAALRDALRQGTLPALGTVDPEAERASITAALERHGWNKVRAARALGISRATLWRKMRALGIPLRPPEGM
jgi:PAS domain S-box-containing protein